MRQDVDRVVADLVEHLRANPAWPEAQAHEGWIAVEAASYFRKLGAGVARDAPYVVVTGEQKKKTTKYADVYVQYQSGTEKAPRHLFFEFKCVPRLAASWKATLGDFAADVESKLTSLDVVETRARWEAGGDAWCKYLGELRSRIAEGSFIGIGLLFVALVDDDRRKRLDQIRARMRDTRVPMPIVSILDLELPTTEDDKVMTLCLAYRVNLTPGSATQESLVLTQDTVEAWRQKGRQEGFQELLLLLLRQRFGEAVDTQVAQRVEKASIEQIKTWAERVQAVAGLAELFPTEIT